MVFDPPKGGLEACRGLGVEGFRGLGFRGFGVLGFRVSILKMVNLALFYRCVWWL